MMLRKRLREWWRYSVCYPIRHFVVTFLSDIPHELITAEQYHHSFFVDDVAYSVVYVDIRGRKWCKSWGIKKPEVPTYTTKNGRHTWIDKLGGMSWRKQGQFYVCKYGVG